MQNLNIFGGMGPAVAEEDAPVEVHKTVSEREETIHEPVFEDKVEIEHVIKNEPVDGPLPIREEGDTVIVPLVKQVIRVEKEWILAEEIRVTKRRVEKIARESVELQQEEAEIRRRDEAREHRGPLGGRLPVFKGKLENWS
jgi:stress response protein YsnF